MSRLFIGQKVRKIYSPLPLPFTLHLKTPTLEGQRGPCPSPFSRHFGNAALQLRKRKRMSQQGTVKCAGRTNTSPQGRGGGEIDLSAFCYRWVTRILPQEGLREMPFSAASDTNCCIPAACHSAYKLARDFSEMCRSNYSFIYLWSCLCFSQRPMQNCVRAIYT